MISIIIPIFNSEEFIAETLDSVLNQEYSNWECVVVDDGSTDDSYNICLDYSQKDSRIKLYRRDRLPKNASTCRNIALEKATGKYVIFLDSDDLLEPFCLKQRVIVMNSFEKLDFAVFQMAILDSPDSLLTKKSKDYLRDFLSFKLPWTITGPIWQKEFLNRLGGFDELFMRIQDPEMHVRALLFDPKFMVLQEENTDCYYRYIESKKIKKGKSNINKLYGLRDYIIKSSELLSGNKAKYKKYLKKSVYKLILHLILPLSIEEKQIYKDTIMYAYKSKILSNCEFWISYGLWKISLKCSCPKLTKTSLFLTSLVLDSKSAIMRIKNKVKSFSK